MTEKVRQGRYRILYGIATILLSIALSSGFAVWYVSYSNSKWCDSLSILTKFDPSQSASDPVTVYGKQQQQQNIESYKALVRLRKSFHC